MIVLSQRNEIRRMSQVMGLSTRQIAKRLGISRTTVVAELKGKRDEDNAYHRKESAAPRLGPFKKTLDELIEKNEKQTARQKRTALALFEELRTKGYEGAYDSVRRYVKQWRQDHHLQMEEAFMPLEFLPGDAVQFDFGTDVVWVKGVRTVVKAARIKLCFSRLALIQVFPTERQEVVMEALKRGYEFFGGVSRRLIVDNMSTAVKKILTKKEQNQTGEKREWTENFENFCGHYLTNPKACTAGRGNEKGQVEREMQLSRNAYFKPALCGEGTVQITV